MSIRKFRVVFAGIALAVAAAGCSTAPHQTNGSAPSPHFKVGKPYKINGQWYQPAIDPTYDRTGVASWYGDDFHGRPTANGEIFDMRRMTAAHTTLPLPSMVEVTNLENGRQAVVRVNDRGPFAHNRIIDLSREAARALGFEKEGLAKVRVRYLAPGPLPGEKRKPLVAERRKAVTPTPVALSPDPDLDEQDELAQLIGDADPGREPALPPPLPDLQAEAAPSPAFVIEIAVLDNIEDLPPIRARLVNEGPLQIARVSGDGDRPQYRINLGPFESETAARHRLEAVREAGYGTASIQAASLQSP